MEDQILDCIKLDAADHPYIVFENPRIQRVLKKLAAGHVLYETGEIAPDKNLTCKYFHRSQPPVDVLENFEQLPSIDDCFPEVCSRLLRRIIEEDGNSWVTIQEKNYRYAVVVDRGALQVRIVIREFLCCVIQVDF